jgi:SAM-dependent methyltransferase
MTARPAIERPVSTGVANAVFWSELCGTALARSLGISDASAQSLRRFDDWYFLYYPYLERYVPIQELRGQRVLEVGLGYGSLAQRLAEGGAAYLGIDIAPGPVAMARHRFWQSALSGTVVQGSILACPFPDGCFDYVISIGCFHHTGNIGLALDETRRVLVPGGKAVIMTYSAYSYRRWLRWPIETLRYFAWDKMGFRVRPHAGARERGAYDADSSGRPAPETFFVSAAEFRRIARDWSRVETARENIGSGWLLRRISRQWLLRFVGPLLGLDLYFKLTK